MRLVKMLRLQVHPLYKNTINSILPCDNSIDAFSSQTTNRKICNKDFVNNSNIIFSKNCLLIKA